MANSPIMTSLPAYVEQHRLPLIAEAVLKAKSASIFNLQTDVKTTAALNLIQTDAEFGDGSSCGWDEAGTSTLSQRNIVTGQIKINMAYCDKEMLKYWSQYAVRVAAGQKNLPFEEEFINGVIKDVQAKLEKAIWQGDKASSDVNLNKFDGLLKTLVADVPSANQLTRSTDVYADVKAVYNAIPTEVLDGAVIMLGSDDFRAYAQALVEKNFYHYDGKTSASEMEVYVPGTNTRVIALNGLNGTSKIVAGRLENFFYGCDMVNDEEKFEFWYSQDNREFRLAIEFNAGVQVAYPSEVVISK